MTRSRSPTTRYDVARKPRAPSSQSNSNGSTRRSRSMRGSEGWSTGSPTSRTFRGSCAPATAWEWRSSHILRSTSGSRGCSTVQPSPRRHMSSQVSEFPSVVDAQWLASELGADDLVVGDVRGPNAHARGHIPGSRPLVLGSPPPGADEASVHELAKEVALRLRRHGITGEERLVLVDRGDGMGAMPAAQMAELAGHPRVAILLGGMAGWQGELAEGPVELEPVRTASLEPNPRALPTRQELASRPADPALTILD